MPVSVDMEQVTTDEAMALSGVVEDVLPDAEHDGRHTRRPVPAATAPATVVLAAS